VPVFLAALHRAEAKTLSTAGILNTAKILNTFVLIAFNVFPTEHKTLSLATLEDTMEQVKLDGFSGRRNPMTALL